jgi:hypothetical protein
LTHFLTPAIIFDAVMSTVFGTKKAGKIGRDGGVEREGG